jgi:hypothetical protein
MGFEPDSGSIVVHIALEDKAVLRMLEGTRERQGRWNAANGRL